jgi:hypothetical protein
MFLITPRMAGTRTAPPQATLGTLRSGATPVAPANNGTPLPAPAPAAPPGLQTAAPSAAPLRVAAPPAPALPARASVVVDLDSMPSAAPPRANPQPAAPATNDAARNAGRVAVPTRVSTTQPN